MKKTLLSAMYILLFSPAWCQKIETSLDNDSATLVLLNEVMIIATTKSCNQQIKDFYIANKAASTDEILSRLPEINMVRRGSYGMEPLIRTYTTGQVNILIDGMRIHGACTDKMDPASIYVEPQNLQSIQVLTSNGTKAGSSIGGTMDLKLREPDCDCRKPLTGFISSGYQSAAKAFYETGALNFSKKKWSIRSNITYRKSSDYKSGGRDVVLYSQYEKLNYGLSAKYQVNSISYLKTDILFDDGWNIGYPVLPMDVGYAAARIGSISLVRNNIKSKWNNATYKIYANSIYHLMDDTHRPNVTMHMDMPGRSKVFGAYAEGTLHIRQNQNIQFRADVSSTNLMASMTMYQVNQPSMYMLTWPDNRTIQSGISAYYQNRLDSFSSINLTSRLDQFIYSLSTQEAKDQLSVLERPTGNISRILKNISAEYVRRFNSGLKVSAIAAYAERMPTSSEFYGFYLFNAFDNYDYIGSTLLKKEQAYKADIILAYTKSNIQLSITPFAVRVNNYILGVFQQGLSAMTIQAKGVKQYENISYADMAGLEALIIIKAGSSLQFISTFKYNYGVDNNKDPLPLIAPFKNTSSIKKQLNKWSLQLDAETASAQNRVNIQAKETATPGFFKANIRVAYSDFWEQTSFRIDCGIENIFDAAYKEHLDWGKIYRPGRNIYAQLSYSF